MSKLGSAVTTLSGAAIGVVTGTAIGAALITPISIGGGGDLLIAGFASAVGVLSAAISITLWASGGLVVGAVVGSVYSDEIISAPAAISHAIFGGASSDYHTDQIEL
jgi:hypothetical protein